MSAPDDYLGKKAKCSKCQSVFVITIDGNASTVSFDLRAPADEPDAGEPMTDQAAFRTTDEQMEWLREASEADGFENLSDWLRHLAILRGEHKLPGKPFPQRKPHDTPKRKGRE